MPNENVPVEIRSSLEAANFWKGNAKNPPKMTTSFRILKINDPQNYEPNPNEIKSFQLLYQRQQQPFEENKNYLDKENIKSNLKLPQNRHYPSPIRMRSSRSIETEVFRRELELDELCFQDHKRKIKEISQRHKEVLTINKALVGHH